MERICVAAFSFFMYFCIACINLRIMNSMFEILMDLPLFQGVSRDKLSELIEKTPFHFLKFADGDEVVAAGSPCTHVKFIISGEVKVVMPCRYLRVKVSQVLSSPNVLGHDYLFGRRTDYPYDVRSHGDCGILQITKPDFINILHSDNIFLFNMLNILSRNSQKNAEELLSLSAGSVSERFAYIVVSLTQHNAKDIKILYKQKDMCSLLGIQRSSFINAMDKLKDAGVIDYTLSEIMVNDRRVLFDIMRAAE